MLITIDVDRLGDPVYQRRQIHGQHKEIYRFYLLPAPPGNRGSVQGKRDQAAGDSNQTQPHLPAY
ncbi:MAG: hypothetical protein A2Z03_07600 [Chloroflexi bacterium RBG_16_56_8]|nr:MAG: hypothetical protein A2Z03_07600 [Chloroflexi bacterium RBG_16_56_8]